MSPIRVAALRRFPVKSLGGERLERAELGADGFEGDRSLVVRDGDGGLLTARTRERMLGLTATLADDGEVRIDGSPWSSEASARAIAAACGEDARLEPAEGGHLWDDTPILITTDGGVAAVGELDPLRFRANIHLDGVDGLTERDWVGCRIRIGSATLRAELTCERCKITTIDPDTLEVDAGVLRRIKFELGGRTGLCCTVAEPGEIAVGDAAEILPA